MVKNTFKIEGKGAFYNGVIPAIIGVSLYKGIGFMMFEYIQPLMKKHTNNNSFVSNFLGGGFSAVCSQFISYPFDIIKKKYQAIGNFGDNKGDRYGVSMNFKDVVSRI